MSALIKHNPYTLSLKLGESMSLEEELIRRKQSGKIRQGIMASGVWEAFDTRIKENEEVEPVREIACFEIGYSRYQGPRRDSRIRNISPPHQIRPSHHEIIESFSLHRAGTFLSWREMFALIDADIEGKADLFSQGGCGLYLKSKRDQTTMAVDIQKGDGIYYIDNPCFDRTRLLCGRFPYGVQTVFAPATVS